MSNFLVPDWHAPANVRAFTTTRIGGVSTAPFDSFNLADHVGDIPGSVITNRTRLIELLHLPCDPHWLKQVHGNRVVRVQAGGGLAQADASFTQNTGEVCAVLTADCLPVLFCDRKGQCVAAAHAGWRGLAAGVLEATLASMVIPADGVLVWLGPAIGPDAFEVGEDVRSVFVGQDARASSCFKPVANGKWLADIYALARLRLKAVGVQRVYGGNFCTFAEKQRFYSYRRDGVTGRMASLIWLAGTD